ncbi:MAG TPA: putative sulfate exporter family transporter, partial [Alphaproteobacteria bacterium]|nr:putative sulfate exporter family transporter [Alphaproteobacteria bacterium]
ASSAAQNNATGRKMRRKIPNIPWFLWLFLGLVTLNSFEVMPSEVTQAGSAVSRWCLLAAIAALGIKTSFAKLAEVGWRPVLILLLNTLFLAGVVGLGLYLDS